MERICMQLTVMERLLILNMCLPREGDIATMRIVRDLNGKMGLTEDEHKKWDVKSEGGQIVWDNNIPQEAEIEMGDMAKAIIAEQLMALDKSGKITQDHLSLCDKFIQDKSNGKEESA